MKKLSLIYPVQSLGSDSWVRKAITRYREQCDNPDLIEHIVVSSDPQDTQSEGHTVLFVETQSRGKRLNVGIEHSTSEFLLFHHPRSLLDPSALDFLVDHCSELTWGAFEHKFDQDHWGLKFTSWYSNYIRGGLGSIYYLDHCLFGQKKMIKQAGGFPEIDIFEDTIFCQRMKKITKAKRLPFKSVTSAIRFSNNGFWKQSYMNFKMKWDFYHKKDHQEMNRQYEEGLGLNSKYEE